MDFCDVIVLSVGHASVFLTSNFDRWGDDSSDDDDDTQVAAPAEDSSSESESDDDDDDEAPLPVVEQTMKQLKVEPPKPQLSKKELKKKELEELDALLMAELGSVPGACHSH
jgi:hypothetical protein